MSLQFTHKDVVQDSINSFAQIHVGYVRYLWQLAKPKACSFSQKYFFNAVPLSTFLKKTIIVSVFFIYFTYLLKKLKKVEKCCFSAELHCFLS